jgi:predicted TPR repeat methyltransferase
MSPLEATVDATLMTRRAREMLAAGRIGAVRPLLDAIRKVAPPGSDLAELSANLLLREGRREEALAELNAAIETDSRAAPLWRLRADARVQLGDLAGALQDAAEAVILEPRDPAAQALLGAVLLNLGRLDEAVACLREAVAGAPDRVGYRLVLANALECGGDAAAANAALGEGIRLAPLDGRLRVGAILLAMHQGAFASAAGLAAAARADGVADARVLGLLGHALSNLGRHGEAAETYAEALKLAPEDIYMRYLVAASGGLPQAPRAPRAYIEAVFNGCAGSFDAHLISLNYRVPGLLRSALLAERPWLAGSTERFGPVLDLGCGTGLVGVALSDLSLAPLVGVDLAAAMLAQARARGLYAELRQVDIETALAEQTGPWALLLAGDVLCYFGALDGILKDAYACLRPGVPGAAGLFLLSVEELPAAEAGETARGWRLGPLGRYAHSAEYVARTAEAAGFAVRTLRHDMLRREQDLPVPGLIVVLERLSHAA